FTQKEYYQMYDFFNRIPERGLDSDPAPPFIKVPTTAQTESLVKMTNEITSLEKDRRGMLDKKDAELDAKQAKWETERRKLVRSGWKVLEPIKLSAMSDATLSKLNDASVLASGTKADKDTYDITVKTSEKEITALRLEALTDPSLPLKGASR